MIPLVDLKAQYDSIKDEIDTAIYGVIANSQFVGGKELENFEANFASWCGVDHCVGVANGTDAIYLALRGLGVGEGDEVITVSHTFTATGEGIYMTGAIPVFVDIHPDTMLINPDQVEAVISDRTKAIIVVHLYGQMCNMDRIMELCELNELFLIEDAAQAHGAEWLDNKAGSMGDVGCFSFYPGKNLGAFGDGGAVISDNENLISEVRSLANHGRLTKYTHQQIGRNSRLDTLQAAVLNVKLSYIDGWNEARRGHASKYIRRFSSFNLELLNIDNRAKPIWHLFIVCVEGREEFQKALYQEGVSSGIHYPIPLHLQPAYKYLKNQKGSLPVTEMIADRIVSLPMYPELNDAHIDHVIDVVHRAVV